MSLKRVKGLILIVCVCLSLFVSAQLISVTCDPQGRTIDVYVLDANDSSSSWVGNNSAVIDGVNMAVADANTNTKVKLAGENINAQILQDASALENLMLNAPAQAVVINTHGEMVPMPNGYFGPYVQIDSPLNGQVINGSVTVEATVKTLTGTQLSQGYPTVMWSEKWNGISNGGDNGAAIMTYDSSSGTYKATVSPLFASEYTIQVLARTTQELCTCATETVTFSSAGGQASGPLSGGSCTRGINFCPYVYVWNGTGYAVDDEVLLGSNDSATDYHILNGGLTADPGGIYALRLYESGDKIDYFDQTQLLAADHDKNANVGVDPNGTILTYGNPFPPSSAIVNGGTDVESQLSRVDNNAYTLQNGDLLDLTYEGMNTSLGAKFVLQTQTDSSSSINVNLQAPGGQWVTIGTVQPRAYWSTQLLNLSQWVPADTTECVLRLAFSGGCSVDFAGVDTTAQANVTVHEGKLAAVHDLSGINATFNDLLHPDGVCAMLKPGYTIDLNYNLPALNSSSGLERNYIFVAKGHYLAASGNAHSGSSVGIGGFVEDGGGCVWGMAVDWQDWFNKIANCCSTDGWIWANVAGYSFHYFGNTEYWDLMGPGYDDLNDPNQPCQAGLKQFLGEDVSCNVSGGPLAIKQDSFVSSELNGRAAFDPSQGAYTNRGGFPVTISASRPIINTNLFWDLVGYLDDSDNRSIVTGALVMSGSGSIPGIFIHSGFSADADERWKGFISTATAIEEARAYIMDPLFDSISEGNTFATVGSATMLAGGWGTGSITLPNQTQLQVRYMDLELTLANHFENYSWVPEGGPCSITYSLSVADFQLTSSNPNIWAAIDLDRSGWETGGTSSSFEDSAGWWLVGLGVDTLSLEPGLNIPYLGSGIGLIPLLQSAPVTPNYKQGTSSLVSGDWANGTSVDPNGDNWGTVCMYFHVCFPYTGSSPITYTFNINMESWLQEYDVIFGTTSRWCGLPFSTALQFSVQG